MILPDPKYTKFLEKRLIVVIGSAFKAMGNWYQVRRVNPNARSIKMNNLLKAHIRRKQMLRTKSSTILEKLK